MPWIESNTGLPRHRKTKRFARQLRVSIPTALGHLHMFWYWAWEYAKDGSLAKTDAAEIAEESAWEGEPEAFLQALIDAEWIDDDEQGRRIHDWEDYGGKLLKKMAEDAKRKRTSRRTSERHPVDVQQPSIGCPT